MKKYVPGTVVVLSYGEEEDKSVPPDVPHSFH